MPRSLIGEWPPYRLDRSFVNDGRGASGWSEAGVLGVAIQRRAVSIMIYGIP